MCGITLWEESLIDTSVDACFLLILCLPSNQHITSQCNINTLWSKQVMRMKEWSATHSGTPELQTLLKSNIVAIMKQIFIFLKYVGLGLKGSER